MNERAKRLALALLRWEWLLLALLLPVAVGPLVTWLPLLLLIPLLWLVRRLATGHFVPPTPLDLSLLALLLMVLVSLFATPEPAYSAPKVVGLVYGIALFYAVVAATGRGTRPLQMGVVLLFGGGVGVALVGLVGTQWGNKLPLLGGLAARLPLNQPGQLAAGQGFNANQVAGVLLWVLPWAALLGLAALLAWRGLVAQWGWGRTAAGLLLWGAGTLLMAGVFLLTQSRSAYVGLLAALLFLLLVGLRRRPWLLGGLVAAGGLLLVGLLVLGPPELPGRAAVLLGLGREAAGAAALNTLAGRAEIWQRALYGIQDFPLTGLGMNMFRRVQPVLYPFVTLSATNDVAHAHNHLLQTALDVGLPGLVAYLALWLGAAGMLWQSWRRAATMWPRLLALGFAASLLAYFVYGLTDAVSLGARPGFIFWLLLGLVAGLYAWVGARVGDVPAG